jgi:cyclopropane fatty-acyl-phospholipid synthase-like methyltransferase
MAPSLLQRVYWRSLRLMGLKALSWNEQFRTASVYSGPRSPNTIEYVEKLCHGGVLLEFGCGEGSLPFVLRPACYSSYIGYDISAVAVAEANRKAADQGAKNVHFEQADMARWEGNEKASLIVAEESLYYLSSADTERFLRACVRSLTSDGSILIIVHSGSKHAATLDVCRRVCRVIEESTIGSRVFLTLRGK